MNETKFGTAERMNWFGKAWFLSNILLSTVTDNAESTYCPVCPASSCH